MLRQAALFLRSPSCFANVFFFLFPRHYLAQYHVLFSSPFLAFCMKLEEQHLFHSLTSVIFNCFLSIPRFPLCPPPPSQVGGVFSALAPQRPGRFRAMRAPVAPLTGLSAHFRHGPARRNGHQLGGAQALEAELGRRPPHCGAGASHSGRRQAAAAQQTAQQGGSETGQKEIKSGSRCECRWKWHVGGGKPKEEKEQGQ